MAIPASSGSSAVDLCEAADLDEATSKLFFSDSSGAVAATWPAVSEVKSTLVDQDSLVALCSNHGVPRELTPVCANTLGWSACTTPPLGSNKICVYSAALDAGLRFPLHPFYIRVLSHYRLAPSQLSPNAWTYMAAFVLLCEDAGVEPLVPAFRWFFALYAHWHRSEPTGHHHFRPLRRLFTGNLPQQRGWKSSFFVLDCPSGWYCPVRWGKPKRADARRVQLTDWVIERLNQKVKQMGWIDIKVFLANREMPVGDLATLTPTLPEVKAETATGAAVGAAADSASTRKRSRLSSSSDLSQPQTLPTLPVPYLTPIRDSSTGGHNGQFPSPQQLSDMTARARAASIAEDEVTPQAPKTMCASDALKLWEAKAKVSEQEGVIAKLNQERDLMNNWNARCKMEMEGLAARLLAATENNNQLKEQLAVVHGYAISQLRTASDEVAQVKALHAADVAHLEKIHAAKVQRMEELAAEKAQRMEELAGENAQLKEKLEKLRDKRFHRESYEMGVNDMMDVTLALHKNVVSPDKLQQAAKLLVATVDIKDVVPNE